MKVKFWGARSSLTYPKPANKSDLEQNPVRRRELSPEHEPNAAS